MADDADERIVAELHEQLRRSRQQERLLQEALTRVLTMLPPSQGG